MERGTRFAHPTASPACRSEQPGQKPRAGVLWKPSSALKHSAEPSTPAGTGLILGTCSLGASLGAGGAVKGLSPPEQLLCVKMQHGEGMMPINVAWGNWDLLGLKGPQLSWLCAGGCSNKGWGIWGKTSVPCEPPIPGSGGACAPHPTCRGLVTPFLII